MMNTLRRLGWSCLLALAACAGEDREKHVNEGDLCLLPHENAGPDAGTPRLLDDREIELWVSMPGCLSSSCDTDRELTCEVSVAGNEVAIESVLAWTSKTGSCDADCGFIRATCKIPPLPAGSYLLRHGDETRSVSVPGDTVRCDPF
jgi:hypothetical protein